MKTKDLKLPQKEAMQYEPVLWFRALLINKIQSNGNN